MWRDQKWLMADDTFPESVGQHSIVFVSGSR